MVYTEGTETQSQYSNYCFSCTQLYDNKFANSALAIKVVQYASIIFSV